ncbi:MAG: DUF1570 domain-containing protein [Planctomycetes bacterium]|nr:DUF1570 domain-containing protein [Planctomycetota bacterium]
MPHARCYLPVFLLLVCMLGQLSSARAVERLLVDVDGRTKKLSGKVVIEYADGSMLLETDEGALWPIMADTILDRVSDSEPMVPLDQEQLGQRLLQEMGPGFQLHESKHYVVVFNTTSTYAIWCSTLLEKLQRGFLYFWKKKGAKIHEPKVPLAVLIFKNKTTYLKHAEAELGASAGNAIGYYSFQTNRIVMYDLTGSQAFRREYSRRGSKKDITALLQTREAEPLVATIIHEATHQIAFNSGLQKRYADNPVWLSEGMAVYFETPNLSSRRLWSGTDKVNYSRWDRFRKNVRNDKAANLKTLIADDSRLRHPRTAVDGYAEAWAWNYFLIKWHPKEYTKYLETLAAKPLLTKDKPATRLADFQQHFGKDLKKLEDEFYRRMSKLR